MNMNRLELKILETETLSRKKKAQSKGVKRKIINDSFPHIKKKQRSIVPNSLQQDSLNTSKSSFDDSVKAFEPHEIMHNASKGSRNDGVFNCTLPGCNKKFNKQKTYDTHIKHFHGIFSFQKSDPIMTASFYDSKKIVPEKREYKSSTAVKAVRKSRNKCIIKEVSVDQICPSTFVPQKAKLSKFSDSEVLLPSSLVKGIEVVSAGKSVAEVIYEDFDQKKEEFKKMLPNHLRRIWNVNNSAYVNNINSDFENNNKDSESYSKSGMHSQKCSQIQSSKKNAIVSLSCDIESQKNLSDKSMLQDSTKPNLLQLSSNSSNLNAKSSLVNIDLGTSNEITSSITHTVQEEHLYASREFYSSCKEFLNKKEGVFGVKSSEKCSNSNIQEIELSKTKEKLIMENSISCEYEALPESCVDSDKTGCGYDEFVKRKEMLLNSIKDKATILKEINQERDVENHDQIKNKPKDVSLVTCNVMKNSSSNSICDLESSISKNAEKSENVDFIRRSFQLCNRARNLRKILFNCKNILDKLAKHIIPMDKKVDDKPVDSVVNGHCSKEENTKKLLHYVFFLDVLKDSAFFSTYTHHILTKTEKEVLEGLTNPISLYLSNTEMELPNIKLRRDREFLQRNSDFFKVLLKIQTCCHILPCAQSSISINELYRPPTRLRLEKSDYFSKVFLDVQRKRNRIYMESYGDDNDLKVSPFVECVCDDYIVHKLSGFVLLPRPDSSVTKDMCVGLYFESTTLSLKDCVSELSSINEEIKAIVSGVQTELHQPNFACSSDMKSNLLDTFDFIDTEAKSVFSTLNSISKTVSKLLKYDTENNFDEIEKELTKVFMKKIGRVMDDLHDLKECDAIL